MTNVIKFPKLSYENIRPTRDTVHSYARILGAIRAAMTPEQKDYWHISLRAGTQGFRTTPIPNADGATFELSLNLVSHNVGVTSSTGHSRSIALSGQSVSRFSEEVLSVLETIGIVVGIDLEKFSDDTELVYDPSIASEIFRSYSLVDSIFKQFKGTIKGETSPVQLWPHHMDIAFTFYPHNKQTMEQIAFGYLTGDSGIEEPYFYITVYPELGDTGKVNIIDGAYWHTEEWEGVVLTYSELIKEDNPSELLFEHLRITLEGILENP